MIQVAGKDFEETDVAPPGGSVEQPWMSVADVDGDGKSELLLAQKNFLRAVVLKADEGQKDTTNKMKESLILMLLLLMVMIMPIALGL